MNTLKTSASRLAAEVERILAMFRAAGQATGTLS